MKLYVHALYFVELDTLFNEAWSLLSKSQDKKQQLLVMESQVSITNDQNRHQCLVEGRCLAIKHKFESLQADMEMFYLGITKKHVAIESCGSNQFGIGISANYYL